MTAAQTVAAHRLNATLAVLDFEIRPLVAGPERSRIAALMDLARREAAELTGMTVHPDDGVGSNVIAFVRPPRVRPG